MTGMVLSGVGHHFPGEPIGNEYFARIPELGVDDTWIREHTGVRTRHWAEEGGDRIAELGVRAAQAALKDAGVEATDVDVIIGTSATARHRSNPASVGNNYIDVSLPVQRGLGASSAFCFDIGAVACAGFLHGSVLARGLLSTVDAETVLVVCAESPKDVLNFEYRNSVLFGAGAAAAVWRRSPDHIGLHDAVLYSDSRHYDAFDIDDTGKMIMDGALVGRLGADLMVDAATTLLARNGITAGDVRWCLPHQGNINMIRPFARRLGFADDQVLINLPHRGNTASVGMPSALSEHAAAGVVRPGDLILAAGVGRGFGWGAMLFTYKEEA